MDIELLRIPEGNVIARWAYPGGPDYEFIVADDRQVYFRVVGGADRVWAGPDAESFRRIAAAWNSYRAEVGKLPSEAAQVERVEQIARELAELGALPGDFPPGPEPLWSILLREADLGMA